MRPQAYFSNLFIEKYLGMQFGIVYSVYVLCSLLAVVFLKALGVDFWGEINFLSTASDNAEMTFTVLSVIFAVGCYFGDYLGKYFAMPYDSGWLDNSRVRIDFNSAKILEYLLIVAHVIILILVSLYGGGLWSRENYQLSSDVGSIISLYTAFAELIIGIVPALSRQFASTGNKYEMYLARYLLVVCLIYLYSASTKLDSASWFLYFIVSVNKAKKISASHAIGFAASLPILAMTLHQRSIEIYGLASLSQVVSDLLSRPSEVLGFALKVFASAVYITVETYYRAGVGSELIFVELDPRPGEMAGWYDYYEFQRINGAVPFSAIGTLAAFSFWSLMGYGVLVAISMRMLGEVVLMFSHNYSKVVPLIYSVICCGFLTQYNLRASARFIYYILFIYLIVRMLSFFLIARRKA